MEKVACGLIVLFKSVIGVSVSITYLDNYIASKLDLI